MYAVTYFVPHSENNTINELKYIMEIIAEKKAFQNK